MRAAEDIQHLNIIVAAQIDGGQLHEERASVPIPPGYDAADVRALVVRKLEDTTFALLHRDFGRRPTLLALLAAVARIRAIQDAIDGVVSPDAEGLTALRVRIREIIATANDAITDEWGEGPEGG